ncbi:MAG TPA: carboxypeptidase-like regulatory domain-containing protein [Mucilaginibacter sp.]|nr:carboxypeptidase-like regulatory domain-containing protein [Mucilaginibacter sp.]
MKIKHLILFLLNVSIASAQTVHLKGLITDARSGSPVPAATISIAEKNLFYPADNDGRFDIAPGQWAASDSLAFSCIGYRTQKVKIGDMLPGEAIKLVPAINTLDNVNIIANAPSAVYAGCSAKFTGGTAGFVPGTGIAMFMTGSDTLNGNIQTVGFFVSNGHKVAKGGDATAPFRIRLYGVDTDGTPGKELTKDIIVASAKKNEAWFDVDLSAYHIDDPDKGFFVEFCLLDSSYYKIREGYKFKDTGRDIVNFASPRLATHQNKSGGCRSYIWVRSIFGWGWEKGPYNDDYLIRAAIMP